MIGYGEEKIHQETVENQKALYYNSVMISKYKQRVADGRCGNCSRALDRAGSICSICSENYKSKYRSRKAKGICHRCNALGAIGTYCNKCIAELTEIRRDRTANKLCITCGVKVSKGVYCELHKKKLRSRLTNRKEAGLCQTCPQERLPHSAKCLNCWLKLAIRSRKLDCTLEELKLLWKRQGEICVYSGREIVLGLNAHIDHRIPVADGGSGRIDNLQFIDGDVNHAKRALDECSFLRLCADVMNFKQPHTIWHGKEIHEKANS